MKHFNAMSYLFKLNHFDNDPSSHPLNNYLREVSNGSKTTMSDVEAFRHGVGLGQQYLDYKRTRLTDLKDQVTRLEENVKADQQDLNALVMELHRKEQM